jgi:hypothetical protein
MRPFDQADDLKLLGGGISHASPPHPRSCFFKQSQFERLFGDDLLQLLGLPAKAPDIIGGGGPSRILGKPALASLQ